MDAKSSDTCYMLERPHIDKLAATWCVKAAHANQSLDNLLIIGEQAYDHAVRWLCELSYISPTVMSKALDIRAAAMLSPFVGHGLRYEDLLVETTLDCADYTVAIVPDFRLAPPRRHIDFIGKLADAPIEAQIAKFSQVLVWFNVALNKLHELNATLRRIRVDKKRTLAFKELRLELKELLTTAACELDVLYKIERTRLYFQNKHLKDDVAALRQCLESVDVADACSRWASHCEKTLKTRPPI
jgi:hypothetical protein